MEDNHPDRQLIDHRYEVVEMLGEGSSGCVHLARDTLQEGRLVALKEMRSTEPEALEYFTHEFALLSGLEHPGLVDTYDYGGDDSGSRYFTMEYVPGGTLLDRPVPMPMGEAFAVTAALLDALSHLHDSACVHFDVKPSNVLLTGADLRDPGAVKLTDFGLSGGPGRYTGLRGTPAFAAPELIRGDRADGRADLYSLGALLYWMLTGRPPFVAAATEELLRLHLEEAPATPSSHRAEIPEDVERFVLRLLAKNPASRFDSARSAAAAFAAATGLEAAPAASPRRAPFVGRQRELALLGHALDDLGDRGGHRAGIHLVTGEAGVGKTRLIDELRVLCQTRGVQVLTTSASSEGRAPLAGLRALLPQLRALSGDTRLPEDATTGLPEIILRAAALSRRPFVVLLDDLESADAPTVDAVRALARAGAEGHMPLLLVACVDEDATANRKLEETLYILRTEEVAVDLPLAPLQEDEIGDLIRALHGAQAPAAQLARRIRRGVGGLPLVVLTTLEFLAASGNLPHGGDLEAPLISPSTLTPEGLEDLPLPENVRDAVSHRLQRLPAHARTLMTLLAISRSPLATTELCELVRRSGDDEGPDLDQAALAMTAAADSAHVARPAGDPPGRAWEVASAIVRTVLLRQLETPERRRLHRVLAAYLADAGAPVEEVAYHAIAGEDAERAAEAAAVTGRRFLELEDHARAREYLEAAARFESDPTRRARATLDLATALQKIGDTTALRAALNEIEVGNALVQLSAQELGKFHLLVGEAEMGMRSVDSARVAFESATQTATGEDLIAAHSNLGLLLMRTGDQDGFGRHVELVSGIAEESGDPEHLAQASIIRGHFHRVCGELERARDDYAHSVEILASRGPSTFLRQAYHHLAWISGFLEEEEQAMEWHRRSNAIAVATGVIGDLARSHRGLGYQNTSRGQLDVAERHLRSALEINDRFGGTDRGYIFMGLAHVHLERCDYREALQFLDEAREEGTRDQHAGLLAEVDVIRTQLRISLGAPDAIEIARRSLGFFEKLGDHLSWESAMLLGLALHQSGDEAAADTVRDALGRATRSGRKDGIARCLEALVQVLPADEEALGATRRLVELSRETRHPVHAILAALAAGRVFTARDEVGLTLDGGETVAIAELLASGLDLARRGPQPEAVWRLEGYLAARRLERGDLVEAGQHARSAYTTLEEIWRQLPEAARERSLDLRDQQRLKDVIGRYNQAVAEAQSESGGAAARRVGASFTLEEPAAAPRSSDGTPSQLPPEAFQSRQPRRRLAAFYEVSRRISALRDRDVLLAEVLNLAIEELDADRGIVFLVTEAGELVPQVRRDLEPAVARDASEYSRRLVEQVGSGDSSVLLADAQAAAGGDPQASALRFGITSLLCVPMRSPTRLVGTLYVDSRRTSRRFSEGDLEFLAAFADLAAVAIENAEHASAQVQRIEELERRVAHRDALSQIVGASEASRRCLAQARRAAASEAPVLIVGETGTGKELVARAIHSASDRGDGPLVIVDCTTLPPALAESELFGHVAGAFTGAHGDRLGLLAEADGGTVFIDEIGDLPVQLQGALLRFLQEGELRPVGSSSYRQVSARVLCATHRDLEGMVEEGTFRQDLFYRINVLTIGLLPLRERREDIPLLVEHFLGSIGRQEGRRLTLTPRALQRLTAHDWPGNVRELENALRGAAVLVRGGVIDQEAFAFLSEASPSSDVSLFEHERVLEADSRRELLEEALRRSAGNTHKAASLLGISLRTLYRRCDDLGVKPKAFRPPPPGARKGSVS